MTPTPPLGSDLVSVVVPARDAAATLGETLKSVLAQTHREIEVLVVDDGSVDATAQVAAAFARDDGRVRILRQPTKGPSAARNAGIAVARGEFIAAIDADDLWRPETMAALLAALRAAGPETGFAYAPHRVIDAEGRIVRTFPVFGCEGSVLRQHLLVNFVGVGSATLMRRSAIDEAGGYDSRADAWGGAEDYLLQLGIAARRPVALVRDYLVGYRRRPGSVSDDPDRARRSRILAVRALLAEHPTAPPVVLRWVEADARLVSAIALVKRRRLIGGIGWTLAALAGDPEGVAGELMQRAANAFARVGGRGSRDPLAGRLFLDAGPRDGEPAAISAQTERRLSGLRRLDEGGAGQR